MSRIRPALSLSLLLVLGGGGSTRALRADGDLSVPDLIRRLGDARWEVREESQRRLIARGSEAVEPLVQASRSTDPEVAQRAQLILSRVDPLVVRVRIRRIAAGRTASIAESLEGQARESGEESGEVVLPERNDPGERSSGYSVRYRLLPEDSIDFSAEEFSSQSSLRTPLLPISPRWGSVSILKRGEESLYRQIGCHVERERHPFIVTLQWWTERRGAVPGRSGQPGPPAAPPRLSSARDEISLLAADLIAQARSDSLEQRLTALEILGLLGRSLPGQPLPGKGLPGQGLPGQVEAGAVFRESLDDPRTRPAALLGLFRLGDAEPLASLKEILEEPAPPRADRPSAPPAQSAPARAAPRSRKSRGSLSFGGEPGTSFWPTRAALALVEAGDAAGFEYLARRISDVPPAEIHSVLAILADNLDKPSVSCRELLFEALSSPEVLIQLPWDDPEIEYFYGRLAEACPRKPALTERLLLSLAHALCGEVGFNSGRPRTFANLWERLTGGDAGRELAHRVVKEVLSTSSGSLRLNEIVAWLGQAFREEPLEPLEFEKLMSILQSALNRNENGFAFTAGSALVELARGPRLSRDQLVALAGVMAQAATTQNQPYAQEILRELERLVGVPLQRTRNGPAAPRQTVRRPSPPGPAGAANVQPGNAGQEETLMDRVARWGRDRGEVETAFRRLTDPEPARAGGEPLAYWEFLVLLPTTRPGGVPVRSASGASPALRPVQVLDGIRLPVVTGVPFKVTDRWGNHGVRRVDLEQSGSLTRYRLNGQSYLELELPVFSSLRDQELRAAWYEMTDVRLGASYLQRPLGERLARLSCIRKAETGPELPADREPAALWQAFVKGYLLALGERSESQRAQAIPLIRELSMREAIPFLTEEFHRSPRPEVAQLLLELGEARGGEFLREELKGGEPGRRFQAAQILTKAGDRAGWKQLLSILRDRPREIYNPSTLYVALLSLDSFLANCSPTPGERAEALDLVVANLHEPAYQQRGFLLLAREAGTDFKFSDTKMIPQPAARTDAQKKSVEAARSWWAAHRPSAAAPR